MEIEIISNHTQNSLSQPHRLYKYVSQTHLQRQYMKTIFTFCLKCWEPCQVCVPVNVSVCVSVWANDELEKGQKPQTNKNKRLVLRTRSREHWDVSEDAVKRFINFISETKVKHFYSPRDSLKLKFEAFCSLSRLFFPFCLLLFATDMKKKEFWDLRGGQG